MIELRGAQIHQALNLESFAQKDALLWPPLLNSNCCCTDISKVRPGCIVDEMMDDDDVLQYKENRNVGTQV